MAPRNARAVVGFALLALSAAGAAAAAGTTSTFGRTDALESVKAAIRLKNFGAAQSDLQRLAAAGNADAQYLLAAFYLNGLGGPRDVAQAKIWLEKSAAKGNSRAAFSLASLYADADPPDPQAAAHWLARARELGFAPQSSRGAGAAGTASVKADSLLIPATQIKDNSVRRDALWLAAEQGDLASLDALATPALVSERDEFGRGALARAADAGRAPAVELLLRRGAPVDAADQFGTTALMLAARAGSAETVEVLIQAHAKVNAVDSRGNTALMHAAASGKVAVVERLLSAGAGVAARNV